MSLDRNQYRRIRIHDVRAAGFCVTGTRRWFDRHDLDFRQFLREGIDADTLLATGDAMAQRVVAAKRKETH